MKKKPRDWKMIIGMTGFLLVFALIAAFFWQMVAKQAQQVKEEEAREEASAISAVYLYHGDILKEGIFVNRDTGEVFDAQIPKEGIYNRKGTLIPGDILEEGDYVLLYGDGVLSGDDPPVYENLKKMKRNGRATLEEAERYRKSLEE